MPTYIVFLIIANRPEVDKTADDEKITKDPDFQKKLTEFLDWIKAEIKAERIMSGKFLLESSEETNIRIDFHTPPESETGESRGTSSSPRPSPSITRGPQVDMSANILCYYTAEFPAVDDVIAWGRSCPISYDGFALEIRQLRDENETISEVPPQEKEWIGDHILSVRKKMLEEGKMKIDEDGTQWVKVEEQKEIREIVSEAEERDEHKEQE